ncbi:MAG TPA: hypothetical protein VK600_00400 [Candidatus Saccharimonadales bacterium]|nr:hypothetical protein [Candidatus Saccharimonadales bacterium]
MDPQRFNVFVPFGKVADQGDGTILIEAAVNDETPDDQGEIVTYEAFEKASGPFMRWANVREMHQADRAAGTVVELRKNAEARTHTAVLHIVDPVAVKKVQTGVYKGISHGGFKTEFGPMRKVADKPYRTVTAIDLREESLVDRPSRPSAVLTLLKVSDADVEAFEPLAKADYSDKQRSAMADKGQALPDGSFPIANRADLSNAIQAFGRAGDKPAAKKHITKRAKALGATDLLPADWPGSTKSAKASHAEPIEGGQMDPENELAKAGTEGSSEPTPAAPEEPAAETHPSTEDATPQGVPAEPAAEQPEEEEEAAAEAAAEHEAEPAAEPTEKASQSKPLAKSAADDLRDAHWVIDSIARLIETEGEEGDSEGVTQLKTALTAMQAFSASEADELGTPEDTAAAEAEEPIPVVVVGMAYASVIGDLAKQAMALKKGSTPDQAAQQRNQALHDMSHNAGAECETPPAPELAKVASGVDTDAFVEGLASRLVDRIGAVASKADMEAVRGEFVGALKPLQDTLAKIAAQPAAGGPLRYATDSRGFLTDHMGQAGSSDVAEALSKASLAPGISPQTKEELGRLAAQELYKAQLAGRPGGQE